MNYFDSLTYIKYDFVCTILANRDVKDIRDLAKSIT